MVKSDLDKAIEGFFELGKDLGLLPKKAKRKTTKKPVKKTRKKAKPKTTSKRTRTTKKTTRKTKPKTRQVTPKQHPSRASYGEEFWNDMTPSGKFIWEEVYYDSSKEKAKRRMNELRAQGKTARMGWSRKHRVWSVYVKVR